MMDYTMNYREANGDFYLREVTMSTTDRETIIDDTLRYFFILDSPATIRLIRLLLDEMEITHPPVK